MPVKRDEMLDVLCMVSKEENLRVTLKHSAKGGLITGATAMAAGFLMGPVGLAVGEYIYKLFHYLVKLSFNAFDKK